MQSTGTNIKSVLKELYPVAWVKANPAVTAPIVGARNVNQLEDSLAAADFEMTAEKYAEISSLSRKPSPATDRIEVLTGKWT